MNKKVKRVLALVAVVAIVAVYGVALIYAIKGGNMAVPVVMACLMISMYLAVYFHIGKVLADVLKRHRDKKMQQNNNFEEEEH